MGVLSVLDGEMQNMFLSCSIKSVWRVHTIIPHFTILPGYTRGTVTALSMPTSICLKPGAAMVHTFGKIYVTAFLRNEPDVSYCHWSAKRHCFGKNGVPKTKQSVLYILSFGFLIIPVINVRPKDFFIFSTVMGTQVWYKVHPVKGCCAAFMAWLV